MKLYVYSICDKAVNAYLPPFMARSKGEAIRSFTDACSKEDSQFFRYASDYYLVELGTWDDATGLYESREPMRIISALEVLPDQPFRSDNEVVDRRVPRGLPM